MLTVCGSIRLCELRAIAFTIKPELIIPDQLTEEFQIFHCLLRTQIRLKVRVADLIDTVCAEGFSSLF